MDQPKPARARGTRKAGTTKNSKEERRKLFVQAMIAYSSNITQSAIAAGFSKHTAASQGSRLLKEVKTKQLLAEARAKLLEKFSLTNENVARHLAAIVNFDPRRMLGEDGKQLPMHLWPDDVAFAVAGVEITQNDDRQTITKHKIWDKNAGIGHAMKALGMSKERLQLEMPEKTGDGEINMLDAARRVAFTLAMGASIAQKPEHHKQPKAKKLPV